MSQDLYAVLGVTRSAPHDEIKSAYRSLARKYHPDKNPGDVEAEEIFKNAAEAYRVLGDAELRAEYDRYGRARNSGSPGADEAPGDVFNEIFGTRPRGGGARPKTSAPSPPKSRPPRSAPSSSAPPPDREGRGSDLRYTLELSFEEAAFGLEREIMVPRSARCPACAGTGARVGSAPQLCSNCGGRGNVQREAGFFSSTEVCPVCDGQGRRINENCIECAGRGHVRIPEPERVQVPAGVRDGTRLKIRGAGDRGSGRLPAGDLYVHVHVKEHPFFTRDEDDVLVDVPIRFADAVLGATIEVPTLDGRVKMRVPPGSQSGRIFRLKGKGIPRLGNGERADQRVRIVVHVPEELSDKQRELLERFAEIEASSDRGGRVREFEALLDRHYRREGR